MNADLYIGIDGGASKISAGIVRKSANQTFRLESDAVSVEVRNAPSFSKTFASVPINVQLNEHESGQYNLSIEEERQAIAYAEACEAALSQLQQQASIEYIPIGIGMPGIKTPDNQGIAVMNNGPRMPRFTDVINKRLLMAEVNTSIIKELGDDNYFCRLGECKSEHGSLRDVGTALYIGGGTGIADALILDGAPVPMDSVKDRFQKTWELSSTEGSSIESLISQNGLMKMKADALGSSVEQLEKDGIYPDEFLKDDPELSKSFAKNIAWLIHYRILSFSQNFSQKVFEKIVLGQRLGTMLAEIIPLQKIVTDSVNNAVKGSNELQSEIKNHYLDSDFLVFSNLTEAPIIGAAAAVSE